MRTGLVRDLLHRMISGFGYAGDYPGGKHQHDTVAVRIDHRLRHSNIIARNQQLAIARRRIVAQRLIDLVDLQDRAAEIVAVLLVAAAGSAGCGRTAGRSRSARTPAPPARCWWQRRCRCEVWRVSSRPSAA